MNKRSLVLLLLVVLALYVAIIAHGLRKRPAAPPSPKPAEPRVTLTLSPHENFLRVTVSDWSDLRQLDAQWEKFFKEHPEITCDGGISFQDPHDPHSTTILCTWVGSPPENAQDHTGPP